MPKETINEIGIAQNEGEWPLHVTKLHMLPTDLLRAYRIYRLVERELRMRPDVPEIVADLVIEDQIPEVRQLRSRIANPIALIVSEVLRPLSLPLKRIKFWIMDGFQKVDG